MRRWGKRSEIHIKSRLRLVLFLCVMVLAVLLLVLSPLFNRGQAMTQAHFKTYFVAEGDTLWEIAKLTLPDNTDIRDYISEIRKTNYLNDANIRAGQKLMIPVR